MKHKLRRLLALILAMSMVLSLLSANVWAADTSGDSSDLSAMSTVEPQEDETEKNTEPQETEGEEDQKSEPEENTEEGGSQEEGETRSEGEEAVQPEEEKKDDDQTDGDQNKEATENEGETQSESEAPVVEQPKTRLKATRPLLTTMDAGTKVGEATYTISDGVLTVGSGEFTIEDWASVFGTGGTSTSANSTAKSIKSVTFESGATLTSDKSQSMFYGWTALRSVDLTNLTASNVTHIGFMFMNCQKLTSVAFGSGFDTSKVNNMRQMFRECSYLTALDLSTFKSYTGNGTRNLYQMFYNCSNLETIRVSDDWNVENASGNETFSGCYALEGGNGTKANGSGDYTYAVIDKDGQPGYFTSASVPVEHRHDFSYSASGSTLTATCSASDCGLTENKVELTLTPPAKTVYGDSNSAAATLEGRDAFNEATGLNIGSSQYYVYYKKGSDNQLGSAPTTPGEYTVKVTISNVAGSSYTLTADYTIAQKEIGLTWADTTFHYDGKSHVPTATATGLVGSDECAVTVTGEQTAIGTYTATASGLSNDRYKLPENTTTEFAIEGWVGTARYTIEEAPSPKKLFAAKGISHEITNGVLTIYGGEFNNADWKTAFANDDFITNTRDKITSVKFVKENETDTAAKLTDSAQGMFQNWAGLKTIDFTNLDTSDVTWMGTMFAECSSLTELDLSPLDTKKVTNMNNMFYKCSKLEKITVGANWKTASSTSHMFSGCNELAGNAGTTYKALFGNYIETDDSTSNPTLPNVDGTYARPDGGKPAPGFFYNAHEHHLTYTVDQNKPWTITATCDADGCYLGDSNNHSVSISLVKPTLYVYYMDVLNKQGDEYDKGASPLATLTMQSVGDQTLQDSTTVADPDGKINGISISVSTFTDANTAAPTFKELTGADIGSIEYYEKGSNAKLDKAPTGAGTYTAKITIGGATASVDYRIAKRFHSPVLISPKQNASFDFASTTEQDLITVEENAIKKVDDTDTSTFEYATGTDVNAIPTSGWSKEIPKGTGEGPFYVFYRVAGDKNHGDAMDSEFPNKSGYANTTNSEHESNSYKPAFSVIVVSKTAPTPPVAKTLTYNSQDQELVEAGSATNGTMQYAIGTDKTTAPTDNWDTAIPKGKEPAVYYVWYRVVNTNDTTSVINEPACVQVPLSKAEPTVTAPTATATYGQTLNDVSMTNPDVNPEGSWAWVDAKATSVGDVGQHTFKAKFTPTDAEHYKAVEADVTVTVNKADLTGVSVTQNGTLTYTGEAQTPEVTAAATAVNDQSVTFTYSKTQDGEYGDMPTVTNVADGGTFYYKASAPNHNDATGSFTVTVNKATPGEVTAPTLEAVTYDPAKTLANVTLPEGWAWATQTDVPTVVNSGYQAALTVDDANYDYTSVNSYNETAHTVTCTVSLTVHKADNPMTYAGTQTVEKTFSTASQTVTLIAATDAQGTLSYEITSQKKGEDAVEYFSLEGTTLTLAENTPAGTYTVIVAATAAGNNNYNSGTKNSTVTVTVNKATAPEVTVPTLNAVTYAPTQTLSDITLTDDWAWVTDTTVPTVVNTGYSAALTVDDANYDYTGVTDYDAEDHTVIRTVLLTVNPADPATPTSLTATYGQTLADVTLPTGWTWKDSTTSVGDVVTTPNSFKANYTATSANYNSKSDVDVSVTVNKAALTIKAKDQSIYVGGTVPSLTEPVLDTHYTVTGLVGSDMLTTAPTLAYQKDSEAATPDNTKAGTYDIVPSDAAATDNYEISYQNGTLTISNRPSSGGSSSGGSTTPTAETITIPVSGEDATVNVTVQVKDNTATVTSADIDKVLEAKDVGTVTVDVSSLKEDVKEVVLPAALVEKVADAVADKNNDASGLEIKLPAGTVTFDEKAVAAIKEQANGKDLHLNLDAIKETALNSAQQTTVKEMADAKVLDVYMTSDSKRISDFKGGSATVSVPYALKDGQVAKGVVAWYVAEDGTKTEVPCTYDGKNANITVSHFSNYVIAYDAEKAQKAAEAAKAVEDAVKVLNELPAASDVKLEDKEAIEKARAAYDALTDEQKATVDPAALKKLTDAEAALKAAEGVEPQPTTDIGYDDLSKSEKKDADAIAKALGVDKDTAAQMLKVAKELGVSVDTVKLSGSALAKMNVDSSDPKGADFGKLTARVTKRTNAALTLQWAKQKKADGYLIYGNKCGKGNKMKLLKTIKKNSTVKWTQKKLKKGTYYKYMVVAYKNINGQKMPIAASVVIHVPTKGGKTTVAKSVKVTNTKKKAFTKATVKKGKTFQLKASEVKDEKKLKVKTHRKIKFESSNKAIATVNAKGKITGKKKGKATVWAYAQNGIFKAIQVTVK